MNGTNNRILQWTKLIAMTSVAQSIVQGVILINGIVIIQFLSTQEYALYTLANTMLGTMTLLADGGVSTSVMALGGKVWQDDKKLGKILTTGLILRRQLAVFSLLVAIPILYLLLNRHSATPFVSTTIIIAITIAFYATLSGSLLEAPIKLRQQVKVLQKYQIISNLLRLSILAPALIFYPSAAVAIFVAGVVQILFYTRLRKISLAYSNENTPTDPKTKAEMLLIVKRSLPNRVFFCLSGQISIWLLSIFGTTESVAEVGALGRLGQIFFLFNSIISMLILPRFSRLPLHYRTLVRAAWKVICVTATVCTIVLICINTVPNYVLLILGDEYSRLTDELVLLMIGVLLNLFGGTINSLSLSRGWVIPPMFNILTNSSVFMFSPLIFDIKNTIGVLELGILTSVAQATVNAIFFVYKLREIKRSNEIAYKAS